MPYSYDPKRVPQVDPQKAQNFQKGFNETPSMSDYWKNIKNAFTPDEQLGAMKRKQGGKGSGGDSD